MPQQANETSAADQLVFTATRALQIECIENAARLHELEADWRKLWLSLPDSTPFQSPEWLLPWWEHYGEGRLLSFAIWGEGGLVGLALFYIYTGPRNLRRRMFLVGTGNTDYLDVLFRPRFQRDCWESIVQALTANCDAWDECNFQKLRPESILLQPSTAAIGLNFEPHPQDVCPVIDLSVAESGQAMLKKAARYANKLQQRYSYSIEQATTETFDEIFDSLIRLHQERWRLKRQPGVFCNERDHRFHREAARQFLRYGILRLYGLRVESAVVAVVYAFHYLDRTYSYLTGFAPEFGNLSVGTILVGHAVEKAVEEGSRFFDFLSGGEAHKYRWDAVDQPTFAMRISRH